MAESGWYAPGTEFDPRAPWNQVDTPDCKFDCVAQFEISKSTTIESNNYIDEDDGEGYYRDTSNIDWRDEYYKQHLTPVQLINRFKEYLEAELTKTTDKSKQREIEHLICECEGWDSVDDDIYEG